MKKSRALTATVACAALFAVPAATVGTAQASGGDDRKEVRRSGNCSAAADWTLKAKERDGGIEVEWEVDSNRVGQRWTWRLLRNGTQFASGARTTVAPSGSWSVERRTGSRAGADVIAGRATNAATGEVCRASLSI